MPRQTLLLFALCLLIFLFFPQNYGQAADTAEGTWVPDISIANEISKLFKLFLPLAGILATVMIMIGGLIWLTSAGNAERIGQAKSYISGAIIGLILALFSYSILYYINPNLVNLKPIWVYQVEGQYLVAGCGWQDSVCDTLLQETVTINAEKKCGKEETGKKCCCEISGCCVYQEVTSICAGLPCPDPLGVSLILTREPIVYCKDMTPAACTAQMKQGTAWYPQSCSTLSSKFSNKSSEISGCTGGNDATVKNTCGEKNAGDECVVWSSGRLKKGKCKQSSKGLWCSY